MLILASTCHNRVHLQILVNAFNWVNPDYYATLYLTFISAGKFKHPSFKVAVVENAGLNRLVKNALKRHRGGSEELILISGLQQSGKSFAVQRECLQDNRYGFSVDLGEVPLGGSVEDFFWEELTKNENVAHASWQNCLRLFLPFPKLASTRPGFKAALQ